MGEIGAYFLKRMEKKREEYQNRADAAVKEALKKAAPEVIKFEKKKYKEIYDGVVYDFYSSYSPKRYKRRRSMFNMLEFEEGDLRISSVDFNEKKMTTFRNGHSNKYSESPNEENLLMTVFVEGYHGGAKKGDQTKFRGTVLETPHPNPGIPHWRAGKRFLKWGKEAARSESPYHEADKKMAEAEKEGGAIYEGRREIRTRYVQNELQTIFGSGFKIQE